MEMWSLVKNIGSIIKKIIIEVYIIVHVIEYDTLNILRLKFLYFDDYLFDTNDFL